MTQERFCGPKGECVCVLLVISGLDSLGNEFRSDVSPYYGSQVLLTVKILRLEQPPASLPSHYILVFRSIKRAP
jgi:hypothetical protein